MLEAVNTSEKSVSFYETTRHSTQEDSYRRIRYVYISCLVYIFLTDTVLHPTHLYDHITLCLCSTNNYFLELLLNV